MTTSDPPRDRGHDNVRVNLISQGIDWPRLSQSLLQHPDRRFNMVSYDSAHQDLFGRGAVWRRSTRAAIAAVRLAGGHGVSFAQVQLSMSN